MRRIFASASTGRTPLTAGIPRELGLNVFVGNGGFCLRNVPQMLPPDPRDTLVLSSIPNPPLWGHSVRSRKQGTF